jgi:hypothetical protein
MGRQRQTSRHTTDNLMMMMRCGFGGCITRWSGSVWGLEIEAGRYAVKVSFQVRLNSGRRCQWMLTLLLGTTL